MMSLQLVTRWRDKKLRPQLDAPPPDLYIRLYPDSPQFIQNLRLIDMSVLSLIYFG